MMIPSEETVDEKEVSSVDGPVNSDLGWSTGG